MAERPSPERAADRVPQESVVQQIGRLYGTKTRVMLHDSPSESGPLLPAGQGEDVLVDDSQYQILGAIAKGGVGVVYKARDKNLGREVALKVLRTDRLGVRNVVERLVEEAQVGGQLQHPGVVPVYGLGMQKDGRPQFAMKLIKGSTFAELLQGRTKPSDDLAKFLDQYEQLCQTMAYCHARGVIHRDLKPANIMVGSFGEVLVVDWGFGKVLGLDHRGRAKVEEQQSRDPVSVIATLRSDQSATQSLAGSIMGTPAYMPPEQALGQVDALDERADVFSLGAILCEILTGEPPYIGDAADVIVMAAQGKLDDAFARLDACDADPALVALARESLASARKERPRNAGALADRLHDHFTALEQRARRAKVDAAKAHAQAQELRAALAAEQLKAETERAKASKERIKSERALTAAEEQRRQSQWEKQRHRRTLLLASSVLLLVLVGGGAYAVVSSGNDRRVEEQETAIAGALREAMDLAAERRWSEAAAAGRGSLGLLPADQADRRAFIEHRIGEWERTQAEEEAAAEQARRDEITDRRLRELRTSTAAEFDAGDVDADYRDAFAQHGIDPADPSAAAAVIRGSAIETELVSGLDAWADLRRYQPALKDRDWRKLVAIAQEADPDPMRTRIRAAHANDDSSTLAQLASSPELDSQPPQTFLRLARTLSLLSDWPGATAILRRGRNRYPDDVWINLELANALIAQPPRRTREAARYLRAALALRPDSDEIRFRLALGYAFAGDWHAAAATYQALAGRAPENPAFRAGASVALLSLGDLAGAQEAAQEWVRLAPADRNAWAGLLRVLAQRSDAQAHLAKADEASDRFAGDAEFLAFRATALERLGRPAEAMQAVEAALAAAPQDPMANAIAAWLLVRRGKPSEAVRQLKPLAESSNPALVAQVERAYVHALRATGELDRNAATLVDRMNTSNADVNALWGVASVLAMQFNHVDEATVRRVITRQTPTDPDAFAALGAVLRDPLKRYPEAVAAFTRATELRPEDPTHLAGLGLTLVRMGRTAEGVEMCRRACKLDPRDAQARLNLVDALVDAGMESEARDTARAAADTAADLFQDLWGAGRALLRARDFERAEKVFTRATELGPRHADGHLGLAQARWRRGDAQGAREALDAALALRPRDFSAVVVSGTAYWELGDVEKALHAFRRVQSLAKTHFMGYAGEVWVRGRAKLADLADPHELRRLAEYAVNLDPEHRGAWKAYALALLLGKEPVASEEACAKGLALDGDDDDAADLHFIAALALKARGRDREARSAYDKGVAKMATAEGPKGRVEEFRAEVEAALGEGK